MAISLQTTIGKKQSSELGDLVRQTGILLELDIAATAKKLKLTDKETSLLVDAIENFEDGFSDDIQAILLKLKYIAASPGQLQEYFVYGVTAGRGSSLGTDRHHGRTYVSRDYPSPLLAEIIILHPQAESLLAGRDPAAMLLLDQLRFLSDHFGGCGKIGNALNTKFPGISGRASNWLSQGSAPRFDELQAVVEFWREQYEAAAFWYEASSVKLSMDHPLLLLAEIMNSHPQAEGLLAGRDTAAMPLRDQLQFLSDYFGGCGKIGNALDAELPGISGRVSGWVYIDSAPWLNELLIVAQFWRKESEINISLDYPLPSLVEIMNSHPQVEGLLAGRDPAAMPLRDQLRFLADHFGAGDKIGMALDAKFPGIGERVDYWLYRNYTPNFRDLQAVAEFWRAGSAINLSMDHPLPSLAGMMNSYLGAETLLAGHDPAAMSMYDQLQFLAEHYPDNPQVARPEGLKIKLPMDRPWALLFKIMNSHPQAEDLLAGRDPAMMPMRDQLQFLSDYFGGYVKIGNALDAKFPDISGRVNNWFAQDNSPRFDDLLAVTEFWRAGSAVALQLDKSLPQLARNTGTGSDQSSLYNLLPDLAGRLQQNEISILPRACQTKPWFKLCVDTIVGISPDEVEQKLANKKMLRTQAEMSEEAIAYRANVRQRRSEARARKQALYHDIRRHLEAGLIRT